MVGHSVFVAMCHPCHLVRGKRFLVVLLCFVVYGWSKIPCQKAQSKVCFYQKDGKIGRGRVVYDNIAF